MNAVPCLTVPALLRPCTSPGHIYAFTGPTPPMCDQCATPDACCTPIDLANQETPTVPDTNPKAARAIADCKLRLELVETSLTHPLARVMAHGADKYGVRNWRTQPIYLLTYVAAIRRHTDAIADGEWYDPDSGEPHAAHVAACCQVVLDADKHGTLTHDHDFAEAGVPGGVAANVEGGAKVELTADLLNDLLSDDVLDKFYVASEEAPSPTMSGDARVNGLADVLALTPEHERGQDELAEGGVAGGVAANAEGGVKRPICGIDGLPCVMPTGCITPCPTPERGE